MKIAIGSDHGGYLLKQEVMQHLKDRNIEFVDCGSYEDKSCDYPEYAKAVASEITSKKADLGILICGTGIGMSMAANKVPGIRAALCHDVFSAEATRQHNDANIICMGARVVGPGLALMIIDKFIDTPFSNDERHIRRISKIEG